MESPFASIEDIDVLRNNMLLEREDIRKNRINYLFPQGFNDIPPIEIARALQCMDWTTNPDSFDLWYDVMKQLLAGKTVMIMYRDENGNLSVADEFVIADRYSDLRAVEVFDKFPIMINWLVGKVAFELEKKYPLSLEDIKALKREHQEPLNTKSNNMQNEINQKKLKKKM